MKVRKSNHFVRCMINVVTIKLLALICLACAVKPLPPKSPVQSSSPSEVVRTDSLFPDAWLGQWTGSLEIFRGDQLLQTIPMEMEITATDTPGRYGWTTTYQAAEAVVKPYELVVVDADKGHFLMDEKNSIQLESYLFEGKKLMSWFAVQNSLIWASHEIRGEELIFEIVAGSDQPVSVSGDQVFAGDTIPKVETFPINVYQRGVLQRK